MKLFNTKWKALNKQQFGRLGEYFAKMLFTSYGWYVYTSEVDDHAIDFVAEPSDGKGYYGVQVKCVSTGSDTCNIPKSKTIIDDKHLICYLRFIEGELPNAYIFRTSEWTNPKYDKILGSNDYKSEKTKSNPEYNIKFSKKNEALFSELTAEKFFEGFSEGKL